MRKFKNKKADICASKESQSKYMKEISKCVKDILQAKAVNDTLVIDEELYDLLKKIQKMKNFENKYREKASLLMTKLVHLNDY